MIATRTTALVAAMALLAAGTGLTGYLPQAFAQNTGVNTDDDVVLQSNEIKQKQEAWNSANAGNVGKTGDGKTIVAGNNAAAVSFQDQDATAANFNSDDDDFITTQVDVCAIVDVAIIC
jgi:hypothetical protein